LHSHERFVAPNVTYDRRIRMTFRLPPGYVFAATGMAAAVVSASYRPILGLSFLITIATALALNGSRGALASIHVRPVDADDPVSPAAIARTLQRIIRGHLLFLGGMAFAYGVVAVRAGQRAVELFAITFALAALFAGPFTSVRRRGGLWIAASAVALGLVGWIVQRARL
jgi:hypothetical protein